METQMEIEMEVEALATPVVAEVADAPVVEGVEAQDVASSNTEQLASLDGPEFRSWIEAGSTLKIAVEVMKEKNAWMAGDWLVEGMKIFLGPNASNQDKSRLATEAVSASGFSRGTLQIYYTVCKRIPQTRREYSLSFAHHRAVADLQPDAQTTLLRLAKTKNLSVSELKTAVKPYAPVKQAVALNYEKVAAQFVARLNKLNPTPGIVAKLCDAIERNPASYSELVRESELCHVKFTQNLKAIQDAARGGHSTPEQREARVRSITHPDDMPLPS